MSIANAAHCSMMGGGETVPYIPINGVRSDGSAYCALPNKVNASSGAFEAVVTITSSYNYALHAWGAHGTGGDRSYFLWNPNTRTQNGFYCFGGYAWNNMNMTNGRHTIHMWRNLSGIGLTIDGANKLQRTLGSARYNDGYFLIFRAGATDGSMQPQATSSPPNIVINSLKVWFGETQVADLTPCREKSSNQVCFYNQIDKSFIKNIGGGTLIEYT